MKILIISTLFYPSIGGIETVNAILADEFTKAGHDVLVLTDSLSTNQNANNNYKVVRKPGLLGAIEAIRWCDISLHACISLKYLWPFLLIRRPVIATHHTWYHSANGKISFLGELKSFLTRFISNIAVSNTIAASLPGQCKVIHNPYDENTFRLIENIKRDKELVFLGRLVSDKGVDILLDSLAILKSQGSAPRLSIIGSGPELTYLKQKSQNLKLDGQVEFLNELTGESLARELNRHKVLVIPSLWEEPFGVVALEGLACGLSLIIADSCGLREASGGFGLKFKRGCSHDLAKKISESISIPLNDGLTNELKAHLSKHSKKEVAAKYLNEIEQLKC